jgi:DNA-binding transcriptional regulator YdaS (Cro superfamily)
MLKSYVIKNKIDKKAWCKELGVSTCTFRHWMNEVRKPNFLHTLKLESLSKGDLKREKLRPDIYPKN